MCFEMACGFRTRTISQIDIIFMRGGFLNVCIYNIHVNLLMVEKLNEGFVLSVDQWYCFPNMVATTNLQHK